MNKKDLRRKPNNWYVITGGPCSGKSTTVGLLAEKGYRTTIEDARHYIDMQRADGKSIEEIKKNRAEFQYRVLSLQIEQEAALPPDELIFLDRAVPDARAYYRFLDLPEDPKLTTAMESVSYKKIFILDCLPLVNDYARMENEDAQQSIHSRLCEVYGELPFPVIHVPVLPPNDRVEFILTHL